MKVISEPGKNAIDRILQLIEEAEAPRADRTLPRSVQPLLHPGHYAAGRRGDHGAAAVVLTAVGYTDLSRPDAAADRLPMRIGDLDPGGHYVRVGGCHAARCAD